MKAPSCVSQLLDIRFSHLSDHVFPQLSAALHWLPQAYLVSSLHLWNIPCPYPPMCPLPTFLLSFTLMAPSGLLNFPWSLRAWDEVCQASPPSPQKWLPVTSVSGLLLPQNPWALPDIPSVLLAPFCSPPAWSLA